MLIVCAARGIFRRAALTLSFVTVSVLLVQPASVRAGQGGSAVPEPPPSLLVRLATGSPGAPGGPIDAEILSALFSRGFPFGIEQVEPLVPPSVPIRNPRLFSTLGLDRAVRIELPPGTDVEAALRVYSRDPLVEHAEIDLGREVCAAPLPDDPLLGQQWFLGTGSDRDIDAREAWELAGGDPAVVLAVLDTGVDSTHPELGGRVLPGYDFVNVDADPSDDNGHGTFVAGVAAASGGNGFQGAGVCWGMSVLPVKVLSGSGSGRVSDSVRGILFAVEEGADIINMSYGGAYSELERDALIYASQEGCVLVAAAGNEGTPHLLFPAAIDEVIAVGATDSLDRRASPFSWGGGSNYGPDLDLVAPGDLLLSLAPGGRTATYSGTSGAAPLVSGVAGLLLGVDPGLSPEAVRAILRGSCDDQVGRPFEDTPGFDIYHGYGRLNAFRAVRELLPLTPPVVVKLEPVRGLDAGGEVITITAHGLVSEPRDLVVRFAGVASPEIRRVDLCTLEVVTPRLLTSGLVDVTLQTTGGVAVRSRGFEVMPAQISLRVLGDPKVGQTLAVEAAGPRQGSYALVADTEAGSYRVRGTTLGVRGPDSSGFRVLHRVRDEPLDGAGRGFVPLVLGPGLAGGQIRVQGVLALPGGDLVASNLIVVSVSGE